MYEEIERLMDKLSDPQDREILQRVLDTITPREVVLRRRMQSYVGEVAIVGDIVDALGIDTNESWLVGKILLDMGYLKRVVGGVRCWALPDCRFPKVHLAEIARRRKAHGREPQGTAGHDCLVGGN